MFQPQAAHVPTHVLPSGHVLVRPAVNGDDVGWMLLDSGASALVIDPAAADALALPSFARFHVKTVGGHRTESRFRVAQSFQLGPLIIEECAPAFPAAQLLHRLHTLQATSSHHPMCTLIGTRGVRLYTMTCCCAGG
jgi:Aspartyl protease